MDILGKEETMTAACEFDRLFTKSVLHIHEKIFFSVDYKSFKKCLEVSKSWNDLLTSESFLLDRGAKPNMAAQNGTTVGCIQRPQRSGATPLR